MRLQIDRNHLRPAAAAGGLCLTVLVASAIRGGRRPRLRRGTDALLTGAAGRRSPPTGHDATAERGIALTHSFDATPNLCWRKLALRGADVMLRQGLGRGRRAARCTASKTVEIAQRARHSRPAQSPPDDAILAGIVEAQLSQRVDAPTIKVRAVDGVVFLGGAAPTREQMVQLERTAQAITGVQHVVNLLHLPRTPSAAPEGAQVKPGRDVSSHGPK